MSLLGLTRQFSWDEPGDGSSAGQSGATASQVIGRGVVTRELEEYVASVCALDDPAAELEYQVLLNQSAQQQLAQVESSRGWLVQALRQPDQQLLNVAVGQLLSSASQASAELLQALEQVQQLDKALASLASQSAASPAPCSMEGSEGDRQGTPLAFAALLAKEKEQQRRAWQLELALKEADQAAAEAQPAVVVLDEGLDEPLVESRLSPDDEEVIQRVLASEAETSSLGDNAFDIHLTPVAVRLAEINARLAELNPQQSRKTFSTRQSVDGVGDCNSGVVDDVDSFQPEEMSLEDARESKRRAKEEASRRAKELAVLDACLRRVRTAG